MQFAQLTSLRTLLFMFTCLASSATLASGKPECAEPETFVVKAPQHARVEKIYVLPGGSLKKGDALIDFMALKNLLKIPAPFDGEVVDIRAREGQFVGFEDVVITVRERGCAET